MTLATATPGAAHRPDTMTSPNLDSPSDLDSLFDCYGDSVSSGGIQLSDVQSPIEDWQPIRTYLGTKWIPTIAGRRNRTCLDCPVYDECTIDVARGDFAWCEDVIPADYLLTNSEHTAYAHAQQGTCNLKHETLR